MNNKDHLVRSKYFVRTGKKYKFTLPGEILANEDSQLITERVASLWERSGATNYEIAASAVEINCHHVKEISSSNSGYLIVCDKDHGLANTSSISRVCVDDIQGLIVDLFQGSDSRYSFDSVICFDDTNTVIITNHDGDVYAQDWKPFPDMFPEP